MSSGHTTNPLRRNGGGRLSSTQIDYTRLITTCIQAGVNALEYLVAVQDHRKAVFANPAAWLPWTYQTAFVPP